MVAEPLGAGRHVSDIVDLENAFHPPAECVQLTAEPFSARVFAFAAKGFASVAIDAENSYQLRRYVPPGTVAIGYVERSHGVSLCGRNGFTPSDLVVGREVVIDAALFGSSLSVWIDIGMQAFTALRVPVPESGQIAVLTMSDTERERLQSAVLSVTSAGYAGDLAQAAMSALRAGRVKPGPNKRERNMYALARRVEDFMWENIAEHITIARMCMGAGCRTRNVTYCFKGLFGLGPIAYFKLRRLAAVHRRLRDPHSRLRIMDVAADFGFWHMGHFSADYRRVFGQTASKTIATARMR
jgi:AraC-like DNA-binding protein